MDIKAQAVVSGLSRFLFLIEMPSDVPVSSWACHRNRINPPGVPPEPSRPHAPSGWAWKCNFPRPCYLHAVAGWFSPDPCASWTRADPGIVRKWRALSKGTRRSLTCNRNSKTPSSNFTPHEAALPRTELVCSVCVSFFCFDSSLSSHLQTSSCSRRRSAPNPPLGSCALNETESSSKMPVEN